MKKYIFMTVIIAVLIVTVPKLQAFINGKAGSKPPQSFTLTLTDSGREITLSAEEYLIGCLYAQIDVSYHIEALKAQAAAAYTYALRLLKDGRQLSDSTSLCQPYFTPENAKKYYGDSYEKYLSNVKEAASFGAAHPLYYENKPIYSVYHSVSAGCTNRPEYIWGVNIPYLTQKPCPQDAKYVDFSVKNEISLDNMRQKLSDFDSSLKMPLDYNLWFTDMETNDYGYVKSIKVGGKKFSGGDIWRILGLKSTAFEIKWNGMAFSVYTKGYGHGAGMSQYTANVMAKEGKTAEEILKYFYDAEVT